VLEPGDVLVAMGTATTMDRLEALFAPNDDRATRDAPL
jgi:K+/H+ antiporter YhaU regulatory subunit KhtT